MSRLVCSATILAAIAWWSGAATSATADDKKGDAVGWVSLFNGKDLAGWKTHPADKAKWEVKDGILRGTGPKGHLFSERGDYANFHYRVEAKINDRGNSGQYFRAQFGPAFPKGYEAQINSTGGDPIKTGSLYFPDVKEVLIKEQLVKPNEWFTQEVIANGDHLTVILNGKKTVEYKVPDMKYPKGHFAIQQHDPGSVIEVRKIEIKELPNGK